ncbi:MAG TPA: glycosyltransferase family 4 protein [Flavisolibacter sp.]|jgi:glycosyltransferase involved in cell wall biosynthesis|nr:glycosyltransferase family 4 protein [Flavisolibacter sp.]
MAKLLVIVSYNVFPPHMGGQKGIVHFYEHLKQHHSIVMAVSNDNEIIDTGYPVKNILFNNRHIALNLLRLHQLKTIIKKEKIDGIIAEHSYTGWIAWLLKKWTGKPFFIHSHNIETSRFKQMGKRGWGWYRRYEKWIHQKADFNFFKTEEERQYALRSFSVSPLKCDVVPYGINRLKKITDAHKKLRQLYNVQSRYIFYFNGTLDYAPNHEAVERIINNINPLLQQSGIDFIILISGKHLSPLLLQKVKQAKTIRYIQFVENVEMIYQASTLFLNPVRNDSGVKTKLVEALANNCTVVSTKSGATGIPKALCGQKLVTTEDGDWVSFVDAVLANATNPPADMPIEFFAHFSWSNIAEKAASQIQANVNYA